MRLFADDTILYRQILSQADTRILQEDPEKLEKWEKDRQMSFNASKRHLLSVTRKHALITSSYTLRGEELQQVTSTKHLGVEFTNKLHWGAHMHSSCAGANKLYAFIHRDLRGCSP